MFSETLTDSNGKQRKRYPYRLLMTPYHKLKSLLQAQQFLKPGLSFELLDTQAHAVSDNDAAGRLNHTHTLMLFKTISQRERKKA